MIAWPDPLHPAIVHFPIVLILLGTVAAIAAVFWRKHLLPLIAGVLLTLGAIGAWVAVETGEADGGLIEKTSTQASSLVDAHEDWAKRTLAIAAIAAVAAIGSAALFRFPRIARTVAAAAAVAAILASYGVYQTGHRGGALVFQHGIGVYLTNSTAVAAEEKDDD